MNPPEAFPAVAVCADEEEVAGTGFGICSGIIFLTGFFAFGRVGVVEAVVFASSVVTTGVVVAIVAGVDVATAGVLVAMAGVVEVAAVDVEAPKTVPPPPEVLVGEGKDCSIVFQLLPDAAVSA